MPPTEQNNKTARYREHRIMLTKWSNSSALAPRYAFLAELILLWLDSTPDREERIWSLLLFYINPRSVAGRVPIYDTTPQEDLVDSPANDNAKEHVKELLEDFLRDESMDT